MENLIDTGYYYNDRKIYIEPLEDDNDTNIASVLRTFSAFLEAKMRRHITITNEVEHQKMLAEMKKHRKEHPEQYKNKN